MHSPLPTFPLMISLKWYSSSSHYTAITEKFSNLLSNSRSWHKWGSTVPQVTGCIQSNIYLKLFLKYMYLFLYTHHQRWTYSTKAENSTHCVQFLGITPNEESTDPLTIGYMMKLRSLQDLKPCRNKYKHPHTKCKHVYGFQGDLNLVGP